MNLRLRINLIITILLFLTLIVGGGIFTIQNARGNVQAEIASTALLALHMLDAEILSYSMNDGRVSPANVSSGSVFQLNRLTDVRHLRIDFYDARGRLRDTNQTSQSRGNPPPKWFVAIMDSVTDQMPITKRKVYGAGHIVGELVITPDPSYEIAEVWEEIKGMLIFIGLFFIIVNILIYYFVGRALRPVDNILKALTDLESGNLSTRLPKFDLPELSRISEKFNVMADTLEESIADNRQLTQRLIAVQEEERKNLARELHDEIGQHLTAIHVDASTILNSKTIEASKESASAIDKVARQMMDIIHTILQRLRPSGLEELGLEAALQELINSWGQRHKSISVQYSFEGQFDRYDESLLITIFRIVQECLTNIAKHSQASNVDIQLYEENSIVYLSVQDNGRGFDLEGDKKGYGLAGIRERVEGLNGKLTILTSPGDGVQVNIELPIILVLRGEK